MAQAQFMEFASGPNASAADRRACRAMIRDGSKSFHAASRLLPEALRDGALALYAFCRLSDDLIDEAGGRREAIATLRRRLDAVWAGRPDPHPADRCLADTIARHGIPRETFDALLDGFTFDVEGGVCQTADDLDAYAECVAGSVGAMMAALMGVRDPAMVERACDLGLAMQWTNVARDVGADAAMGRIYLPLDWFRAEGVDPERFLARPAFSPGLGRVVARALAHADTLYRRADGAIARLPGAVRPAIHAARLLYSEIGAAVAARGFDSVSGRASVPTPRKVALIGRALQQAARPVPASPLAVRDGEDRALVAAVSRARATWAPVSPAGVGEDLGWLADLFGELDARERAGRRGRPQPA